LTINAILTAFQRYTVLNVNDKFQT